MVAIMQVAIQRSSRITLDHDTKMKKDRPLALKSSQVEGSCSRSSGVGKALRPTITESYSDEWDI